VGAVGGAFSPNITIHIFYLLKALIWAFLPSPFPGQKVRKPAYKQDFIMNLKYILPETFFK
jgi:hypothetical protein